MLWLALADNPSPGSQKPPEDGPERPAEPPPRGSLFTDVTDGEELLQSSDLDAIDASMQRAGGINQTVDDGSELESLAEEPDEVEDDAVDDAAAEASMAYVESHGEDGPPPAEPVLAGPLEWLVPWVISLAAHAALVIAAIFIVWSVQKVLQDEEIVVPIVTLSETPGPPLEVQVAQRVETEAATPAPVPAPTPTPVESDIALDLEMPGLGEPAAVAPPSFELSLNDAAEFDTNFFGSGGNAKNIVFVIEADGSIISDYPQIVDELAKSVRALSPKQKFTVIVFDGEGVKEVPPSGLKRADADAKASSIKWLRPESGNVETRRTGDPVKALQLAFRRKPELIFLLSQNLYNPGMGQYEIERDTIIDAVKKGARTNIVINTIQFNDVRDPTVSDDPQSGKPLISLLEEIAQITGGEYLQVTTNAPPANTFPATDFQ